MYGLALIMHSILVTVGGIRLCMAHLNDPPPDLPLHAFLKASKVACL